MRRTDERVFGRPSFHFLRAHFSTSRISTYGRSASRCRCRTSRPAASPNRAPVPTNAPDDPSYVGSTYGLGKPSYYGLTPPLGVDDPFGRPLLRYCP